MIEPYREIMADRGFKIREDYIAYSTQLCIIYCMQLLPEDVSETSNIANVRIYGKQAIDWIKVLLLVKTEVPITCDCWHESLIYTSLDISLSLTVPLKGKLPVGSCLRRYANREMSGIN